jgi:uncharacterized protein YozE (UPF0346 family)
LVLSKNGIGVGAAYISFHNNDAVFIIGFVGERLGNHYLLVCDSGDGQFPNCGSGGVPLPRQLSSTKRRLSGTAFLSIIFNKKTTFRYRFLVNYLQQKDDFQVLLPRQLSSTKRQLSGTAFSSIIFNKKTTFRYRFLVNYLQQKDDFQVPLPRQLSSTKRRLSGTAFSSIIFNKKTTIRIEELKIHSYVFLLMEPFKGIISRDFAILFLFNSIDMNFLKGPDQVYF